MKNRSPLQSGVALVIVLGFLVLISVLVVAFFSSVTTELKASRNYSSGVTTRQLSESATQVVMGQIRAATTRTKAAWASQPGMIRTYRQNANTAGSNADAFFKLYSSDKMVVSGNGELRTLVSSADFADDWNMQPALWTDLNAPVIVENNGLQVPRFPIIDPRAYVKSTSRNKTLKVTSNADPSTVNTEGFWYGSDTSFPTVPNGLVGPGGNADDQRLPMPVRWIYVLQDGTLTSPPAGGSSTSGTVAKWTAGTNQNFEIPTKENPIVGRIAFWADDDSSKVNVNTAGGFIDAELDPNLTSLDYDNTSYAGSFWDTPRFYTDFDRGNPYRESLGSSGSNQAGTPYPGGGGLAICQLLQNEFQRYPGHPSTTSLGIILGPYMKTPTAAKAGYTRADQMYSILPRLGIASNNGVAAGQQAGSTKGGIFRIIPSNPTAQASPVAQDLQIMPKGDRLYASLDELYFAAKSTDPANSPNFKRITNDKFLQSSANPLPSSASALSADNLEKLRFFLTAQSRSPELNLFGFPRISIWPVRFENATDPSGLNPFDNVILFCSTIGVDPNQAGSGRPNTMKAPGAPNGNQGTPLQTAALSPGPVGTNAGPPFRYIFTRREMPTAGGAILPTPVGTWSGINSWIPDINQPRNKQLMVYLQQLTNMTIPGFGGAFVSTQKYSQEDRDQILTEIFDYIRCANLQDTTTRTIGQSTAIQFSPKGVVLPSKPTYLAAGRTYTGFGRFPALSEASIVFYYAGPEYWGTPTAPLPTRNTSDAATNTGPQLSGGIKVDLDGYPYARYMRAFMLFSFFNPMQGYAPTKDPGATDPKILIDVGLKPDGTVSPNRLENFTASYLNDQGASVTANLNFPQGRLTTRLYRSSGGAWGGRNYGGFEGFMHTLVGNDGTSPVMAHKIMEPTGGNFGTAGNKLTPDAQLWTSNGSTLSSANYSNAAGAQEAYPFQTMGNGILIPYSKHPNVTTPGQQPDPISTFNFSGGRIDVVIRYGGDLTLPAQLGQVVQAATIEFPPADNLPIPKGDVGRDWDTTYTNTSLPGVLGKQVSLVGVKTDGTAYNGSGTLRPFSKPVRNSSTGVATDLRDPRTWNELTPSAALVNSQNFVNHMRRSYWDNLGGFYPYSMHGGGTPAANLNYVNKTDANVTGYPADQFMSWSFARRLAWSQQTSNAPWRNSNNTATLNSFPDRWRNIVQPGDTIRSMIYYNTANGTLPVVNGAKAIKGGDLRLALIPEPSTNKLPDGEFAPHPDYNTEGESTSVKAGSIAAPFKVKVSRATSLRLADGNIYFNPGSSPANVAFALKSGTNDEDLVGTYEPSFGNHVALNGSNKFPATRAQGNLPASGNSAAKGYVNGVLRNSGDPGDFDTGIGIMPDGPYLNKPDEGNIIYAYLDPASQEWRFPVPYFGTWAYEQPGNTFTSPFRQMPSPGMFGSLPSRTASRRGWETLCFTPAPAGDNHPGNVDPKDHLLLDLFNMPVVEPYPISEPFSSAGKVNLNYKIMPFGYIGRSTAMRAALHPVRVTAVNANTYYAKYKTGEPNDTQVAGKHQYDVEKGQYQPLAVNFRYILDRDQTIQGFDDFFADGANDPDKGFFKAASQVCERYLYPYNAGLTSDGSVKAWWKTQDLGGDNTREKPYADLYPRVTTKSNTFTVHMRVQTLRQIPRAAAANYATWEEGRDAVLGEYRGAATIERYIDPADPRFDPTNENFINPDNTAGPNLESIYRFRTVITKKFAPY